jgi:hypothetical protein
MPLVRALIRGAYASMGKLKTAWITLPGNRGTGTANEASVKSRKNAKNTAPPRINIPPLPLSVLSVVLYHALQDFGAC